MKVLVIDHRDSFVFNLVHDLEDLGAQCRILRSSMSLAALDDEIESFAPELLLLSPGPGAPENAELMLAFLSQRRSLPVFGVCLGLQAITVASGGRVGPAAQLLHGRASGLRALVDDPLFEGLPEQFSGARYHSLACLDPGPELEVIARSDDDLVMALRHRQLPWSGLQFHPESVLSPTGPRILENLLESLR